MNTVSFKIGENTIPWDSTRLFDNPNELFSPRTPRSCVCLHIVYLNYLHYNAPIAGIHRRFIQSYLFVWSISHSVHGRYEIQNTELNT